MNNCKIHLKITKDVLNSIYDKFINSNVEWSGIISFEEKKKDKDNSKYNSIDNHDKIKSGDGMNVRPSLSLINYHTHPHVCYQDQETIFGWLSGEDIYATIQLCLRGVLGHLTFTLEGIYFLQIDEEFINAIKKHRKLFNDKLLDLIKEYFMGTHECREYTYINKQKKKKKVVLPYSFVDILNNFKLSSLQHEDEDEESEYNIYFGKKKIKYSILDKKKLADELQINKECKNIFEKIKKKHNDIFNKKIFKCTFIESDEFSKDHKLFGKNRIDCIKKKCKKSYNVKVSNDINILNKYYKDSPKSECSIDYFEKKIEY
jgi:hypothetical protein